MTSPNILVPIDLDDESTWRMPISTAVEYSSLSAAKVHVMTVVPTDMMRMTIVAQMIPEDFEEKLRFDAEKRLAAAIKRCVPDDHNLQRIVRLGNVPAEILQTARDIDANLIIMAAHKPKLGDFMTGSTTDQVTHRSPCSVWIIRE